MEVNAIQPVGISKVSDSCKHTLKHTHTYTFTLEKSSTSERICLMLLYKRVSVITLVSLTCSPWLITYVTVRPT